MNDDADNGFWVHTIKQSTGDWPPSSSTSPQLRPSNPALAARAQAT